MSEPRLLTCDQMNAKATREDRSVYVLSALCAIAFLAHLVSSVADHAWDMLIIGSLMIPLGVIHGAGVLTGAW